MDRHDTARAIYDRTHLTGEFTLRSGIVSNEYFDKYLFESDPVLLHTISAQLAPLVPDGIDALAGLELGGVPIATVLSQITGHTRAVRAQGGEDLRHVPSRRGRRSRRSTAARGRRRHHVGRPGDHLGRRAPSRGAVVEHAVCVIDRESGGPEGLADIGVELRPLFTMTELRRRG